LRPGGLVALAALLGGCSGISDNDDGIATVEIRLPANFYLEHNQSVTIRAVARAANGDSVDAAFRWRTPDTVIAVDSTRGTVTALLSSGTGRVQAALFGKDSIFSILDSLKFTLTAVADTGFLTTADSIDVPIDVSPTAISFKLEGGTPRTAVSGRPITFSIIEPVPADTPVVIFASGRAKDSTITATTGIATISVGGRTGKTIPDRAVVEINAYRATGAKIPGSGKRVVIRFLHQTQ
jgi:hypothetical protein